MDLPVAFCGLESSKPPAGMSSLEGWRDDRNNSTADDTTGNYTGLADVQDLHLAKPVVSRPTNNQLMYKAYFKWQHYHGLREPCNLPTETDACPSVAAAYLQVLKTLHSALQLEQGPQKHSVLEVLATHTRKTKVVELPCPRVATEKFVSDENNRQFSTKLDRNRYGKDDNYLFTVICHCLDLLDLCPCLVDVEIIDAKSNYESVIVCAGPDACTCDSEKDGAVQGTQEHAVVHDRHKAPQLVTHTHIHHKSDSGKEHCRQWSGGSDQHAFDALVLAATGDQENAHPLIPSLQANAGGPCSASHSQHHPLHHQLAAYRNNSSARNSHNNSPGTRPDSLSGFKGADPARGPPGIMHQCRDIPQACSRGPRLGPHGSRPPWLAAGANLQDKRGHDQDREDKMVASLNSWGKRDHEASDSWQDQGTGEDSEEIDMDLHWPKKRARNLPSTPSDTLQTSPSLAGLQAEVEGLRAENKRLRMENGQLKQLEIEKKALEEQLLQLKRPVGASGGAYPVALPAGAQQQMSGAWAAATPFGPWPHGPTAADAVSVYQVIPQGAGGRGVVTVPTVQCQPAQQVPRLAGQRC